MSSTPRQARGVRRWLLLGLTAVLGALALMVAGGGGAVSAATTDTADDPWADQEVTKFYFQGVIRLDDDPVPDVPLTIEGDGLSAETTTGPEGRWRFYIPEQGAYQITITLPEGVSFDESRVPPVVTSVTTGEGTVTMEVTHSATSSQVVNLFFGEGTRETTAFAERLLVRIVMGLNFGLLLALAAMGAALIYGTTGLSNFAHGEMVTWGPLVALVATTSWSLPLWLSLLLAVVGGLVLGLAMDAGLWRPLRRRGLGVVQLMIVSIGLSLALRYIIQFIMGGATVQLPGASPAPFQIGPIRLSYIDLISMGVSIVAVLGVAYFLLSTRVGKATRAISDNPSLAAASGINVDRVVRIVWVLASGLAAVAGVLWAYFRPGAQWNMGTQMLLLIFAAMTLGGLGTAFGALVGSLIVGLVVELSTLWIPSDLKYAGALVVLIVILLVRPQGLLGRKERLG